ncbi:hypothetical protein IFR04_014454 [Cadophora malorum]|uniref:Uncharacterized protein n=1 Tax=Cadophora malorum TaxID=108018 RepID=A0A8H7T4U0_9HELO|nr:hypothetical protein IFR04_014454 [Cadophora malorum]
MLKSEIKYVLAILAETGTEDDGLSEWLGEIQSLLEKSNELCTFCYEERQSAQFANLTGRSRPGEHCAGRFKNIIHHINRLSRTIKAVRSVVSAARKLQPLFSDFSGVRAPSGFASPPPLEERNPTLEALAGRMANDTKPGWCSGPDHQSQRPNDVEARHGYGWFESVHADYARPSIASIQEQEHPDESIGAARTSESDSSESECEKQDVPSPDVFDKDEDSEECEPELVGKWELTEGLDVGKTRHEDCEGSGEHEHLEDGYWSDGRSELSEDDEVDGGVSLFAERDL